MHKIIAEISVLYGIGNNKETIDQKNVNIAKLTGIE
jgi:hypothetical protein